MSDEAPVLYKPTGHGARILEALAADQPLTSQSICRAIDVPHRGQVIRVLERLERHGLVRNYKRSDGIRLWALPLPENGDSPAAD